MRAGSASSRPRKVAGGLRQEPWCRLWVCPARSALLVAGPVVPNDSDVIGRSIDVVAGAAQLVVADIGAGRGGPGGRAGGAVQGIAARCKLMRSFEQRGRGRSLDLLEEGRRRGSGLGDLGSGRLDRGEEHEGDYEREFLHLMSPTCGWESRG